MAKMWAGRTDGATDRIADDFNTSIGFDSRMFRQDIKGSMAHATMLSAKGIIGEDEADAIIGGLDGILADLESGKLAFDSSCEDIHMFVEEVLTARIGDAGKSCIRHAAGTIRLPWICECTLRRKRTTFFRR